MCLKEKVQIANKTPGYEQRFSTVPTPGKHKTFAR